MRTVEYKIANEYAKTKLRLMNEKQRRPLRNEEYKEIANRVYGSEVKPLHFMGVKKHMNKPEVKKLAENRIMQLLDEYGLTENKSSELIEESIKIAKKQENAKLLLEQAKYLNELRGLAPNKTVISETRQFTGSDLLNNYTEAKKTIKVSKEVNSNNLENGQETRQNTSVDSENEQETNNE